MAGHPAALLVITSLSQSIWLLPATHTSLSSLTVRVIRWRKEALLQTYTQHRRPSARQKHARNDGEKKVREGRYYL